MTVEALVERSREGDVDAFAELVRRYQAMAFGYARAVAGDIHTAEDATQQAFLTAWVNLARLREPVRFGGWLRGIVRYESLRLVSTRPVTVPVESVDIASGSPEPDARFEAAESDQRVLAAIAVLPERERVVATLYYLHDQSQREVANFLNVTVDTVNNRLRTARKHLRQGGMLQMSVQQGIPDFAGRIGRVIRAGDQEVEARFERAHRPAMLGSVRVERNGDGASVAAFVSQFVDDYVVRLTLLDTPGAGYGAGAKVVDEGTTTGSTMESGQIAGVISSARVPDASGVLDSGIRVIDLFAPLVDGGVVALLGELNVGKLVLVEELFHRLAAGTSRLTLVVFMQVPDEAANAAMISQQASGGLTAIFLPVADASMEALAEVISGADTALVMSRERGKAGLYPAIDPVRSWSKVDASNRELIEAARNRIAAEGLDSPVWTFLAQPFYVAEPFTHRPGETVARKDALAQLRELIES